MAKAHSRMISEKFLNDLESGILQPVTEMVKNDPELFLAFRGGYINVYYRGGSLFMIEPDDVGYQCTFDFNYGRYTEDQELLPRLQKLQSMGMSVNEKNDLLWDVKDCKSLEQWEAAKDILASLIDDHCDESKQFDYLKKKLGKPQIARRKPRTLEKQAQQKIIFNNRFVDNGFFVYDMEYQEPGDLDGRFDLLALQVKDGLAIKLWMLEVKSRLRACTDAKTGMAKHKTDMNIYLGAEKQMAARRRDIPAILEGYRRLFGWTLPECPADIQASSGFVLTGEARRSTKARLYRVCKTDEGQGFRIYPPVTQP